MRPSPFTSAILTCISFLHNCMAWCDLAALLPWASHYSTLPSRYHTGPLVIVTYNCYCVVSQLLVWNLLLINEFLCSTQCDWHANSTLHTAPATTLLPTNFHSNALLMHLKLKLNKIWPTCTFVCFKRAQKVSCSAQICMFTIFEFINPFFNH